MNKTLISVLLAATLLLGAGNAMASDSKLTFAPSLNADLVYDLSESRLGLGPSLTVLTFAPEQCASIKAAWIIFPDKESNNKLGLGVALSVPKVMKALGAKNVPDWFVPSTSVYGLVNLKDEPEYSVGISVSLIEIKW